MNIFSKLFKKTKTELPIEQIFQNSLKIKAEIQISDVKVNGGMNFKITYKGSTVPFWMAKNIEISDALSTIAVGLALDLNLVEISQALQDVTK